MERQIQALSSSERTQVSLIECRLDPWLCGGETGGLTLSRHWGEVYEALGAYHRMNGLTTGSTGNISLLTPLLMSSLMSLHMSLRVSLLMSLVMALLISLLMS